MISDKMIFSIANIDFLQPKLSSESCIQWFCSLTLAELLILTLLPWMHKINPSLNAFYSLWYNLLINNDSQVSYLSKFQSEMNKIYCFLLIYVKRNRPITCVNQNCGSPKCHVFFKPYLGISYHMLILSNVLLFLLAVRPTCLFKNVVSLLLVLCFSTHLTCIMNDSSTHHEIAYLHHERLDNLPV